MIETVAKDADTGYSPPLRTPKRTTKQDKKATGKRRDAVISQPDDIERSIPQEFQPPAPEYQLPMPELPPAPETKPSGKPGARGPVQPLPRPPRFDMTEDPAGFFKYWATLSREELDRSLVYVYRNWPVWSPEQLLTDDEREKVMRKELRVVTNIGKLSEPWEPRAWEHEIYHRYGAGDYHFKLNDVHFKKTVCMVSIKGLRDFDNYPPVLDPRAVVVTDPANASYLERMRLKGKRFPGDNGYGEEDMGAETVKELSGTVERLATRLADNSSRQSAIPDAYAHGQLKAVEAVAEGSRQGMKIMESAMTTAEAARAKAQDPTEHLRGVIEIAKLLTPPPHPPDTSGAQMLSFMQSMMAMQQETHKLMLEELRGRLNYTERTLQAVLEKQNAPPALPTGGAPVVNAPGSQPRSILDDLDKLATYREKLDGLFGGGGGDGTPGWVPAALQGLSLVVAGATNFAHNLAVAKTGMGQAIAPPALPQMEQQETDDQTQNPNPGEQEQMSVLQFAQRLHRPLVNALEQGVPGHQFGAQMVLHEGAMAYSFLAGQGKDGILSLLQQYPPIWQDVIRVPQQFDQFLNEFINHDAVMEMVEELKATASEVQQVQHEAQAPPLAQVRPQSPPPAQARPFMPPKVQEAAPTPPKPEPAPVTQAAFAAQPGEQRRKVKGPDGKTVEVIAPRPEHRPPTINKPEPPDSAA